MSPTQDSGPRVNLFGRPGIDGQLSCYQVRSRKSWALLAYLVLNDRPPTRSHLAGLLFGDANDPLGALRWGLSEIRRALRGVATIEGDPVVLRRHRDLVFDVDVVGRGRWASAVRLPALGSELLEGMTLVGGPVFDFWLLAEQRRLAAATNEVLGAASRAADARGDYRGAIGYAVRRLSITPLDEDCHADLIRLYRLVGDDAAAQRQYSACRRLLDAELGTAPGPSILAALEEVVERVA